MSLLLDGDRTVEAPARTTAGSGVTVGVSGAVTQYLLSVCFRLATSAVVGNRTPKVTVLDGTGVALASCAAGFATTAGTTVDYTFAHGLSEWDSAGTTVASGPCPNLPLGLGDSILLAVDNMDAGDLISNVRVTLLQSPSRGD